VKVARIDQPKSFDEMEVRPVGGYERHTIFHRGSCDQHVGGMSAVGRIAIDQLIGNRNHSGSSRIEDQNAP
jgi:hypothetical protein